jgi:Domain of unknown function (DUF5666)
VYLFSVLILQVSTVLLDELGAQAIAWSLPSALGAELLFGGPMPVTFFHYSAESIRLEKRKHLNLSSQIARRRRRLFFSSFFVLVFLLSAVFLSGCASGVSSPVLPPAPTSVTVLLSAAANDQLLQFNMSVTGVTVTNKAGTTVNVFSSGIPGRSVEFIHLNGAPEPLVTLTVPQDSYISAVVTVATCQFTNLTVNAGGLDFATYAQGLCQEGTGTTTVNLSSPITVSGNSMALLLDLQVSQSYTLTSAGPPAAYTINPVFTLTPVPIAPQPTNPQNGKFDAIDGRVASVNGTANSFTVTTPDSSTLTVNSASSTVYQGIGDFSALAVGNFVEMDLAIQSSGSLLAIRIAVRDAVARDVFLGPIAGVYGNSSVIYTTEIQQQGDDTPIPVTYQFQYAGNTVFNISGQLSNVGSLPFNATFTAANMIAGQNIYMTSSSISLVGGTYSQASTITLIPQTVNASVTDVSSSNGFQIYNVTLAPYDLFPILSAEVGQSIFPSNPTSLVVYVDRNAQLLNVTPLAAGGVFRFNGLVFNDNGTLRMDCRQVNDGVLQ